MSKYKIFRKVLQALCAEAPTGYKTYYPTPDKEEAVGKAMSLAYIHLFLKVKFGLIEFSDREQYVTDGTEDGGIDGYYIDRANRKIYFIQSKLKMSAEGFEQKNLDIRDIFKMDIQRIVKGETTYENGNKYNEKIQNIIRQISEIHDIARYDHIPVILANVSRTDEMYIKRLLGYVPEIYNYERCYNELIFKIISGTYFNPSELKISIMTNPNGGFNRISYSVKTALQECNIYVVFVPTMEIAKILYKHKNAVLKYNPRSYLGLKTESVNWKIKDTIESVSTNEFSLFNNGITMLSDKTVYSDEVGKKNTAEILITNPQIINGGQTAFTLSTIYEECKNKNNFDVFDGKEVLLKIITFDNDKAGIDDEKKLQLIEDISRATNDQTAVTDADRRSNDRIQIELQDSLFDKYGVLYERKRGEFGDGVKSKYIEKNQIIEREYLVRTCMALQGHPNKARSMGGKTLFREKNINGVLEDSKLVDFYYAGLIAHDYLNSIQTHHEKEPNNRYGINQYGNAIRYGKYAVISVLGKKLQPDEEHSKDKIIDTVNGILSQWIDFEKEVVGKVENSRYFKTTMTNEDTGEKHVELNFDNYYKGYSLLSDLVFFDAATP